MYIQCTRKNGGEQKRDGIAIYIRFEKPKRGSRQFYNGVLWRLRRRKIIYIKRVTSGAKSDELEIDRP